MTDETKKLFDAPWAVDEKPSETFGEVFDVMDEDLYLHYARCYDEKTANRLARLPELYDALMEAARNQCCHCLVDEIVPMNEDLIEECPKHIENCFCRQWWKLLKKVRDGE